VSKPRAAGGDTLEIRRGHPSIATKCAVELRRMIVDHDQQHIRPRGGLGADLR
jgi:hypothetical protein